MPFTGTTLAQLWRAFFVTTCLAATVTAGPAPVRTGPPLKQIGKLDPAEAKLALEQLRHLGIAGNYYLEFELRVMPRRGEERVIQGKQWGGRDAMGTITRVSLMLPAELAGGSAERRLLIRNGPQSAVWRREPSGNVEMLGVSSLFEPLVAGTDLTAFDLQMPYIYWDAFTYEGIERFLGRPSYVLFLQPPAEFKLKYPALSGVRIHLDTQYSAPMQTQLVGKDGEVLKTISMVDLKKVGDQWIPKAFDSRDETTRNKTRMSVTAAALDVEFSRALFEPAQLADDVRPPTSHLVRLDP
jgi:hypothetical protein